jgi:pantoate--beta-alanine ligase
LHAGHEALLRAAAQTGSVVIVSIFANPAPFGAGEKIADHTRGSADDLTHLQAWGAEAVFTPSSEELFPRGFGTFVSEEVLSKPLCGISRPNHFRGMATLMVKLINIIRPDVLFFGQKTAQRAAVVRKVAQDLGFPMRVEVIPTVRDVDGLALGVRNNDFTPTQRLEALALSKALRRTKEMADAGVRIPDRLVAEATHILSQYRKVRVIYVAVVDTVTLEPVREVQAGRCMVAIAAWVDEVRLIDNIPL